jgi:ATP-binding cassette, subfamily B, bacterial PglK
MKNLQTLWRRLSKRRHKQFFLLLVLMFFASIAEMVSIGAVLPFVAVLTSPDQVYDHELMGAFVQFFNITSPSQLVLPLTIVFILAVVFAALIRLFLLYFVNRLSFATGADLSVDIYRRTLYQKYSIQVSRNSSEIINSIITKTRVVTGGVITPVLSIMTSCLLLIGIIIALITINALITSIAAAIFASLYFLIIRYTRQRIKQNSKTIAKESTNMVKFLQEGLGGIRDILLDGTQDFYARLYRSADLPLRKASREINFVQGSPKFIMEALGMVLIAFLAYIMINQAGSSQNTVLPTLAALALGAQRTLPSLQQFYAAYTKLKGSKSSFEDVLKLLDQPLPIYAGQKNPEPMIFKSEINLKDLSFRYSDTTPWVLKGINLKLKKGSRIGFKGSTGIGKSTLLDLVMGLFEANSGSIFVDGEMINKNNIRAWQMNIAHVPQSVYLSDSSIAENIAFGIPKEEIDHNLLKKSAEQAQISELIESWPKRYKTYVGERGIRLSGGQRQRIGIARALYKRSKILILDEATSALDSETEEAVMNGIRTLDKDITILIIAHRLTTLELCDKVIDLPSIQQQD